MKILVFYSGGKDSQACLIWAVKKYGVDKIEAVFCDTGWENPVTYSHIHETTKTLGVKLVTLKNQRLDGMIGLVKKKKRWPSTKARFCTSELKSIPAIDYILSLEENVIAIEGIRAGESFSRSQMTEQCTYFKYYTQPHLNGKTHTYRKKDVLGWIKKYNADKIRPIFNWTAEQTITYILENGQKPNPLYYMGFQRVGCFPCIMARMGEIKLIMENHPERWQEMKDFEKETGSSFFSPGKIPKHAQRENGIFPTINDVETYIKGKNETLDMFDKGPIGCMSVYNLCE